MAFLVERQPELSVVAEARDGLGAIELADEVEIDAAVIDVHMPLLDGVGIDALFPPKRVLICPGKCRSGSHVASHSATGVHPLEVTLGYVFQDCLRE